MSENLTIWNKFADIDPKFTKAITGKAYKGTSPNPQYVIQCLTELFGPVGLGFGWDVEQDEFTPIGEEVLHWCRIRFWHTDRANGFSAYGQTKALMKTRNGLMLDEDAPKKSLTDAITKAASHIGIGANIFLGRWDDSKYVEEVNAEYRKEECKPAPDAVAAAVKRIEGAKSGKELLEVAGSIGDLNTDETVAKARVDRIIGLVRSAPNIAALGAMEKAFSPDWAAVRSYAENRANELTEHKDQAA